MYKIMSHISKKITYTLLYVMIFAFILILPFSLEYLVVNLGAGKLLIKINLNEDIWMGFIGSYLGFIGSTSLGIIAI